ncbi:MAG: Mandelate racemase/muconate lactonizing enzyme C-terminal domain protein [Bryobacterales bacterium]|nr:Mandelate racemase/muconate lactonizing enzyme C-terminal domain protein [Bryobacterales bacterium]
MQRRNLLKTFAAAGLGGLITPREQKAQTAVEKAVRGLPSPKIKDVQVIETAPAGVRLTVVKIVTDQDGLYGYGCATFTQRADLVKPAVEKYLKPLLLNHPVDRIEDTWQMCYDSSYWKNGPVLNNAISGVDQALWDIKGRMAKMPVYDLVGGKCREAADVYRHASGAEIQQCIDQAKQFQQQGIRHIRVQVGVPGYEGYGAGGRGGTAPVKGLRDTGTVFESAPYIRRALKLFEEARKQMGPEIELLHDVHERVTTHQAVQFAKACEPFNLFFLEDPLSPEDIDYFRQIRQQCSTPIAMGELFNSPHEWMPLVSERLIDYIRIHVSQAGGFTPCRKVAILGELFGVKTAWHGPGDVSPVGHMANVTLDVVSYNFGVQEYSEFNANTREVFHGVPVLEDGYVWPSTKPGWGIEIDEKAAAKFPFTNQGARGNLNGGWGEVRRRDGQIIKQ